MRNEFDKEGWFMEVRKNIANLNSLREFGFILQIEDHHFDYFSCVYLVTQGAKKSLYQHILDSNLDLSQLEIKKIIYSVLSGL